MLKRTGHGVTVARVLWEDLVPVRIWVPRQKIKFAGVAQWSVQWPSKPRTWVRFPSPAQIKKALIKGLFEIMEFILRIQLLGFL